MEESVPCAGKTKARGTKVLLIGFDPFPAENAWLENPIPTLKKKSFALSNRVLQGLCCLLTLGTNLLGGKFFLARARPGCSREMDQKIDASVTTNHLCWPNEGRKFTFLLPIRLPNPNSLSEKRSADTEGGGAMSKRNQNQKITRNTENEKRQ